MLFDASEIESFLSILGGITQKEKNRTFPFLFLYSFMGSSVVSIAHVLYAAVCVALGFGLIKKGTICFGYGQKALTVFLLVRR